MATMVRPCVTSWGPHHGLLRAAPWSPEGRTMVDDQDENDDEDNDDDDDDEDDDDDDDD